MEPRSLNIDERRMLSALLARDFAGVDALRAQIARLMVADEREESVILRVDARVTTRYPGQLRVPVFAEGLDRSGQPIEFNLHVIDGQLNALELVKHESRPVMRWPDPETLRHYP
jgi:hypothetical protein